MKAFLTILRMESCFVLRGIDTLFFGVGFPALVAICLCLLVQDTNALASSFAAVSTIGICATGLMGIPLTLADYRHRKVLKRYCVTPISPFWILFTQFVINFVIALLSMLVVYWIMYADVSLPWQGNALYFLFSFILNAFALYGVGLLIASVSPTVKIANLICTLLYFPMIFLSGTVIPYELMPAFLQRIMDFSPLTQGIVLLNHMFLQNDAAIGIPILVLLVIGCSSWIVSVRCFRWS